MRKLAISAAVVLMATAAAHAEIKIGAVLSVTGPASFLGEPEKKTLEMYVRDINAHGGVLGQQITTVVYDDGGDASKARTVSEKLKIFAGLSPRDFVPVPPALKDRNLDHPDMDPIWEAAQDHNLSIVHHSFAGCFDRQQEP